VAVSNSGCQEQWLSGTVAVGNSGCQ